MSSLVYLRNLHKYPFCRGIINIDYISRPVVLIYTTA